MTPYREIVESDMPDHEKLEMIGGILDGLKEESPGMAFLVDMVVYHIERLDKACKALDLIADVTHSGFAEMFGVVRELAANK